MNDQAQIQRLRALLEAQILDRADLLTWLRALPGGGEVICDPCFPPAGEREQLASFVCDALKWKPALLNAALASLPTWPGSRPPRAGTSAGLPALCAELLLCKDTRNAAYLVGCLSDLLRGAGEEAEQEAALRELIGGINALGTEVNYLSLVQAIIPRCSVWAVCGRKTAQATPGFNEANRVSQRRGNRVCRIFLPPNWRDADLVLETIAMHLEEGMVVRVFGSAHDAASIHSTWNLPAGFGMTLMGAPAPGRPTPALEAVLIHWGGVGGSLEHRGVILRENAWKAYFWALFQAIEAMTVVVPAELRGRRAFLEAYPHYRSRGRGGGA